MDPFPFYGARRAGIGGPAADRRRRKRIPPSNEDGGKSLRHVAPDPCHDTCRDVGPQGEKYGKNDGARTRRGAICATKIENRAARRFHFENAHDAKGEGNQPRMDTARQSRNQKNRNPRGQPSRKTGNTGTQENLEMEGWRGRLCPARFLAYQYSLVKTCTKKMKLADSSTEGRTEKWLNHRHPFLPHSCVSCDS